MTKIYELLYIISSTLSDDEIKNVIEKVDQTFKKASAEVAHHGVFQKRKLAYPVKHALHGTYILAYVNVEPSFVQQVHKELSITPEILRHTIISRPDLKDEVAFFVEKKYEKSKPKPREIPIAPEINLPQDKLPPKPEPINQQEPLKEKRKPSLKELDEELENIIEGDIEL